MSERQEFILKYHSIQNKFSCPNTPSSSNGEPLGKQNLSILHIEKNQKGLKRTCFMFGGRVDQPNRPRKSLFFKNKVK